MKEFRLSLSYRCACYTVVSVQICTLFMSGFRCKRHSFSLCDVAVYTVVSVQICTLFMSGFRCRRHSFSLCDVAVYGVFIAGYYSCVYSIVLLVEVLEIISFLGVTFWNLMHTGILSRTSSKVLSFHQFTI
jgi:hypothetical protein